MVRKDTETPQGREEDRVVNMKRIMPRATGYVGHLEAQNLGKKLTFFRLLKPQLRMIYAN